MVLSALRRRLTNADRYLDPAPFFASGFLPQLRLRSSGKPRFYPLYFPSKIYRDKLNYRAIDGMSPSEHF